MKFKPKEIAVPALILCAICLIITGALSVTNFITKDTIEALNLETEKEARTVVLPDAHWGPSCTSRMTGCAT